MFSAKGMEKVTVVRDGQFIDMRRCPDCWTYRDSYPHFDNGYVRYGEVYFHHLQCPSRANQ